MLPPDSRLTASSDIKSVVVSGSRVRTSILAIYTAPSNVGHIRFACIAGKKVHASAVIRHAVQRKLRAACKELSTSLVGSYDIVVVALSATIRSMSLRDVERDIAQGVERLGIKEVL